MTHSSHRRTIPTEGFAGVMRRKPFASAGQEFELLRLPDTDGRNLLISQGSGNHPYVLAEPVDALQRRGHNGFVMLEHGRAAVPELMARHTDALVHIQEGFGNPVVAYGEVLGGYVAFYLALAPMAQLICQNSPAILTDPAYRRALRSTVLTR